MDVDDQKSTASESDSGNAEPIQLFDHEGKATDAPVARNTLRDMKGVPETSTHISASGQQPVDEPVVFREDAMVGVTDTMCATGKSTST